MAKFIKSQFFPPPQLAEPTGVVLFGGQLAPPWLLDAYSHGIFPWPIFDHTDVLVWWSPDPRAIFEIDQFRATRRLMQTAHSGRFQVTIDCDFAGVIRNCASVGDRGGSTWITPAIIDAYQELHRLGHAHSVEVWQAGQLVGGVYGVAIGALFAGESMFHTARDASKVALTRLVHHLRQRGYRLFDIQQLTPHTASLGAIEISRDEYLSRLADAIQQPVTFGESLSELPRRE